MPATPRMPSSRAVTARMLVLALAGVLVLGVLTIVSGPARAAGTSPVAAAGALVASGEASTELTTEQLAKKARKKRLAAKRKRARIRARRARAAQVHRVVRARGIALAQRGDRYGYGASGPHAFDCSGLVQFAFHNAGFRGMPRTSGAQAAHTRRIPRQAMRPGDLMFFSSGGGVYHVGIFVGRGPGGAPRMVHSSRPGTPVSIASPWTDGWFAGTMRPKGA